MLYVKFQQNRPNCLRGQNVCGRPNTRRTSDVGHQAITLAHPPRALRAAVLKNIVE